MRDPEIFQGERILIRQIPSMSEKAILATFTDKNFISDRTSIILTDINKINIYYSHI